MILFVVCDDVHEAKQQAITKLQQCIEHICDWMVSSNSIKLNQSETEMILFSKVSTSRDNISIMIGTANVESKNGVKIRIF